MLTYIHLDFFIVPFFDKKAQVGHKKDLKNKIIAVYDLYFRDIFMKKLCIFYGVLLYFVQLVFQVSEDNVLIAEIC